MAAALPPKAPRLHRSDRSRLPGIFARGVNCAWWEQMMSSEPLLQLAEGSFAPPRRPARDLTPRQTRRAWIWRPGSAPVRLRSDQPINAG